ncbi:MAG: tRNA preQ1(34) S-adenosylmethionine ribosyltransferase-isomerase QueA [Longimicrobiaceae bacterium]
MSRAAGFSTSDYDYRLPPERIARYPAGRRDQSRLLHLQRLSGALNHLCFSDLAGLIPPGDALVLNQTRVFPARLSGRKKTGGAAEVLLLRRLGEREWLALVRPGKRVPEGTVIEVAEALSVEVVGVERDGGRRVVLHSDLEQEEALERYGTVPLPPYLGREPDERDRERYQTVYARETGSVAAPTAGLHLTPEMLLRLERRGVRVLRLVLHVGAATFRPVESEDPAAHRMPAEWYRVPDEAAAGLNQLRREGGACWAVGTTVARALETVASADGFIRAGEGWTDLFIRPPYRFRAVQRLITNFHLPRSTLLMLVAAFAGYAPTMRAYREAVAGGYRFYSYGDAMLVT